MTNPLLFYIPTVSKSLLIVLGTFTNSAAFWSMESAAAWKTKPRLPHGLDNKSALPTLTTAPMTTASFLKQKYVFATHHRKSVGKQEATHILLVVFIHSATPNARTVEARACELGAPALL